MTTSLFVSLHPRKKYGFPDKYAIEAGVKGKTRVFDILFVKKGPPFFGVRIVFHIRQLDACFTEPISTGRLGGVLMLSIASNYDPLPLYHLSDSLTAVFDLFLKM